MSPKGGGWHAPRAPIPEAEQVTPSIRPLTGFETGWPQGCDLRAGFSGWDAEGCRGEKGDRATHHITFHNPTRNRTDTAWVCKACAWALEATRTS